MESLLGPVATACDHSCTSLCRSEIQKTVSVPQGVQECISGVVHGTIEASANVKLVISNGKKIVDKCQEHEEDAAKRHARAAQASAEQANSSAAEAASGHKSAKQHIQHLTSRIDELEHANRALLKKTSQIEEQMSTFGQATSEISAKADAAVEEGMKDMKTISSATEEAAEMTAKKQESMRKASENAMNALSDAGDVSLKSEKEQQELAEKELARAKTEAAKMMGTIDAAAKTVQDSADSAGVDTKL